MKTNFSLLFYMKKQKNYRAGAAPIYMRITVNGKRAEVTTGRECPPERWNAAAGRVSGTREEIRALCNPTHKDTFLVKGKHRPILKAFRNTISVDFLNRLSR